MGFFTAVGRSYANILNFSGRASRAEFWWFVLFQMLVGILVAVGTTTYVASNPQLFDEFVQSPEMQAGLVEIAGILGVVNFLFIGLPAISSLVRRFHDSNHSGWWYFIILIPIAGIIVWLIFMFLPSDPGRNTYGPNPYGKKGVAKVRLPRGMKPAPSEAERRAEILEYYRKNVMREQGQPT